MNRHTLFAVTTLFAAALVRAASDTAPAPLDPVSTCVAPPSGMAVWYPGDGNAADIASRRNGTLRGGATFAAGMVDEGFSFNGTDAYIEVPHSDVWDNTSAGSIDAWVYFNQKPSAAGHIMEIVGTGNIGADFDLQADTDDKFRFYIAGGNCCGYYATSTIVIQTGVWYHVAGAWDSTNGINIYVNGALEQNNPVQLTRSKSGLNLMIGNQPAIGGRLFNGLIDEVEIFNRRLTDKEVASIFTAGAAGKCKPPQRLLNISTRMRVLTGNNVLIGGFIITGNDAKQVLVRALGPSLSAQNVSGALQDPTLALYTGQTQLDSNDHWKSPSTNQAAVEATGLPPSDDRESALVGTLSPANYTAVVSGKGDSTGVGLVEVYDLEPTVNSELANISTRGFVDTDNNVMIGGFIGGGSTNLRVLLRGIGPSLSNQSVADALQDPVLQLFDIYGTLVDFNDNWRDASNASEIEATGIPPSDNRESAMVRALPPGNYTAVLQGKGGSTGVGLVEVYKLQDQQAAAAQ